jgi:hypothetical protein
MELRKNCEFSGWIEFRTVLRMLDSFFLECHPTSTTDMPPFNKSTNFPLSLKLSTCAFILLSGPHLLFEKQVFTMVRLGKYSAENTMI